MGRRRQFTAEFKTKLVLEVLREEKQIGEITTENGLSPNQLRNWKNEFLENAPKVFSETKQEKELRHKERTMVWPSSKIEHFLLINFEHFRAQKWYFGVSFCNYHR